MKTRYGRLMCLGCIIPTPAVHRNQIMITVILKAYTIKVYPNAPVNTRHNLMEVPPDNPNEYVRLKRFPPRFFETMVDWTTTHLRRRPPARR